jgi:release factor glutamine methyltransferase
MIIRDILEKSQKAKLRTEMEIYLAFLLACSRLDLLGRSEEEIPVDKLGALQKAWLQIQEGVPVAYLVNTKDFYGRFFYVDENVLIPRGETEMLVDWVKELASSDAAILEVGTGSGAIAVTLKLENPKYKIMATDVSAEALEVARKNAANLGAEVEFIQSDLLESIPERDFEILVANLPYIGVEKFNFIAENVEKFEPHVALLGGSDGLDLYRKMFDQILRQKRNFKYILGEIGFCHGETIKKVCEEKFPDAEFELRQDYSGLDRHFMVKNPR